jgi:4-amino-4-deoxy-L-arabinose transferase-like glycosyltransferase
MAKRQESKKKKGSKKTQQTNASTSLILSALNRILKEHTAKLAAGVFVLSLLISGWYYQQAYQSPATTIHQWDNSDMAFFDTWASYLEEGNWWCDTVIHPYHDWHDDFAASYLKAYPEEAQTYYTDPRSGEVRNELAARKALINDIYKGKTFHQEPLYTYMVAITYSLFGKEQKWIYFWNFLLAAFTSVLVFLIGRKYFDALTGILAALFVTLCGTILVFQMVLFRTTLTNFFTVLLLYVYLRVLEKPNWKNLVLFGVSSGFSLLAQSYFILFLVPAWVWFIWVHRKNAKSLGVSTVIFLASLCVVLSPLCIRNYKVGVPLTAMAGHGAMAYIPMNTVQAGPMESFYVHMPTLVKLRHDGGGKMIKTAFLCLKTFPSFSDFWRIYKLKINGMFMWHEIPNNMNYYLYKEFAPILGQLPVRYYFLAPLGLAGLILGFYRYRQKYLPFLLMTIACMLPIFIAGNLARYRTPLVIMMALAAAYAIFAIAGWILDRRWKEALMGSGLCLLAFLYTANTVNHPVVYVGANDLHVMYTYHYRDRLMALEAAGNTIDYLALTTELMGNLPDYFFEETIEDRIKNQKEADAALYAVNLIRMHAVTLQSLNKPEEANYYSQKADVLFARGNRLKELINQ